MKKQVTSLIRAYLLGPVLADLMLLLGLVYLVLLG